MLAAARAPSLSAVLPVEDEVLATASTADRLIADGVADATSRESQHRGLLCGNMGRMGAMRLARARTGRGWYGHRTHRRPS
jgi:hypothetical protein